MGCPASGEFDGEPDATAAPGVGSDGRSRWPARTARRAGAAGGGAGTGTAGYSKRLSAWSPADLRRACLTGIRVPVPLREK